MPIARRPQRDVAEEKFIAGAGRRNVLDKKKTRVMVQLDPDMLSRLDAIAKARGMSRSAMVQWFVSDGIREQEEGQ